MRATRTEAADAAELRRVAEREALDLLETAELCGRGGLELTEISVGSTPTARFAAAIPGVTEIRPGTYIFNDVQQMRLGVATEATCGARILATVVARPPRSGSWSTRVRRHSRPTAPSALPSRDVALWSGDQISCSTS